MDTAVYFLMALPLSAGARQLICKVQSANGDVEGVQFPTTTSVGARGAPTLTETGVDDAPNPFVFRAFTETL